MVSVSITSLVSWAFLMVQMGFCVLNKTLMVISFVKWELSVIIHNRLNIRPFKELRNCLDVLKM